MTTISTSFSTDDGIVELSDKEFWLISDLVHERFGINLTDKKKALVRGRLNSLVKSQGFSTFEEYYKRIVDDTTGGGLLTLIDRISTNHSFFFREADHFDFLTTSALPEILQSLKEHTRSNTLRIWCAGSAAGEEPYTLAMVLTEFFGMDLVKWDVGILATDISVSALSQAAEGVYPAMRVEAVPAQYRKYFTAAGPERCSVVDRIKKMVLFKKLNLMRESFPFKAKFNVIFCRNVMIYFDQETKRNLVDKFRSYMYEGGYLFIGHSETLGRETGTFRYIKPTVYRTW